MSSDEPISSEVPYDRPPTIGLSMIVKNEAQVILRCLDSVRPLVDYVLIEDTGSTDGTQQIIREWLERENVAGAVIEEPWRDFAYNRSHALAKLREVATVGYALIMDADDRVVTDPGFDPARYKAGLRADLYDVQIRHGSAQFYRPQLFANQLAFCFKAVLHEYLEGPPGTLSRETATGFHIQTGGGGARNKNPNKYQDDAAALEQALRTETDPFLISRYTFYLAQSYRDCGEREKALENYLKRAQLGYWIEEVFESLYNAAKLQRDLDHPEEEVIATYLHATDVVPTRAEALHSLSNYCRSKGRNEDGFQYAKQGLGIARPEGGLFLESWIYDYGLLDELAINGYWSGHYREALDACLRLLGTSALPADQRDRIAQNARFALEKLPKDPDIGSARQLSLIERHALVTERPLRSQILGEPRVLLAILAKQKAEMLPLYLECIEALDYPKSSIVLHVRTNNNTDGTERVLSEWLERVGSLYAAAEFDASDVPEPVQQFAAHEWNATRFEVLGRIRNHSLQRALDLGCAFYFVADVDNFIRPATLRELVALNLPIVAPLLRSLEPSRFYSNYHAEIDDSGYYKHCDQYIWILQQWIRGVIEVPVVHTTYLIRADVIPELSYLDETARYEYVIFSDSARKAGVPQYIDNRQVYGYIAFGEGSEQYVAGGIDLARRLISKDGALRQGAERSRPGLGAQGATEFLLEQSIVASTRQSAPVAELNPGVGSALRKRSVRSTRSATSPELVSTQPMDWAGELRRVPERELDELAEVHLINLDRGADRLGKFKERNAHLHSVVRVSAIDGLAVDRNTLLDDGTITDDLPYKSGTLGCALSHIQLWRKAASLERVVTVFEDDTISALNFIEESGRILSTLPKDWDLVQWGWIFDPLHLWLDFGFSKANLRFYDRRFSQDVFAFQRADLRREAVRLVHSFGTMSYSVSPGGARKLLERCLPLRKQRVPFPGTGIVNYDTGIDVAMCAVYGSMQSFLCIPPLVVHDSEIPSVRQETDVT